MQFRITPSSKVGNSGVVDTTNILRPTFARTDCAEHINYIVKVYLSTWCLLNCFETVTIMAESSKNSGSSKEEIPDRGGPKPVAARQVAIKSTAKPGTSKVVDSRQVGSGTKHRSEKVLADAQKFMGNFDPEKSGREKRKLATKILINIRRPNGALYDETGRHIATGIDMCDCLNEKCSGCYFPCPKCNSSKCGLHCRIHRKFMYEEVECQTGDGTVIIRKNPLVDK